MAEATGRLKWDQTGEKIYETGVSHGVLYVYDTETNEYGAGEAWNGLSGVTESPTGAEATAVWADNQKYLSLTSAEEFGATIEAYMYPDAFEECDGSATIAEGVTIGQQTRKMFGLSYQTIIGNDVEGDEHGYKIHIIYGAKASPSEKAYQTVSDSPEAMTLSWEVTTTPVNVPNFKPTASLVIDSRKVAPEKLKLIEDALYGTDAGAEGTPPATAAKLLLPEEIIALLAEE